jgi:hypothetical protein
MHEKLKKLNLNFPIVNVYYYKYFYNCTKKMHLHSSHSPTFDNGANKSEIISNILMVDLPEQLKNLTNNAENLERVAQYL